MANPVVVALDPGSSAAGVMVFELIGVNWTPIEAFCVKPKRDEQKRKRIRRADEDARIIGEIARAVSDAVRRTGARWVVSEIPEAGAARYSTCRAISLMTGWVVGVVEALQLAYEWYTPREVKQAGGGSANASKTAIIRAMSEKYPILEQIPNRGEREHVADAAAAFEAARGGQMLRMLEQQAAHDPA